MSIESSGKPHPEDESSAQLAEGIVWLPRAPLRSARRGGGLLTGLTILTAGVLATAAGVAALARHTDLATLDLAALQIFSADEKAADRAPAAHPAASFRAAAPTVTPSPATPDPEPVDIASEKIALDGPASVATTPASSRVSELMPDPERIVPSPEMFKTPAPFYDPLPPIPSSSAPPLPPLAPSETPPAYAPIARSAPTAPTDAGRPAPARAPERQT
ncbi:MAG: hypothetical protein K2Y29_13075, partial [Beijerinckiaceae bacterium]|nr:hypothetical protein [Beijerinckiaceae bacterium]